MERRAVGLRRREPPGAARRPEADDESRPELRLGREGRRGGCGVEGRIPPIVGGSSSVNLPGGTWRAKVTLVIGLCRESSICLVCGDRCVSPTMLRAEHPQDVSGSMYPVATKVIHLLPIRSTDEDVFNFYIPQGD